METTETERAEETQPQRATVILCAWRNLLAETAECMLQLRDQGWGYVIKRGDALISRSRSIAVSNWYQHSDDDVFLMIDDDVVFESSGAQKVVDLARKTRSVACAAYPVKDGTHLACRRFPGQEITFGQDSEPVEIIYPATGFMAVHRDVIAAMIAAQGPDGEPHFPKCTIGGLSPMWPLFDTFALRHDTGEWEYLSEDYAFGEVARRLGFKVWLEPSVTLFHMGFHPYHVHEMQGAVPLVTPVEEEPVVTTDGFRLHLPPGDEVIAQDLRAQGAWDIETGDALREILRPGDLFLDLGAHIGYFSLLAASRGCRVLAVEPVPDTFALLNRNVELNGGFGEGEHAIETFGYAVDVADGLATMTVRRRNTGAAHLIREGAATIGERVTVAVQTLPQILRGRRPDVVKIDIEGGELKLLRNNPSLLDHARAVVFEVNAAQLQTESHGTPEDLFRLFIESGFALRRVIDRGEYSDWLAIKEAA